MGSLGLRCNFETALEDESSDSCRSVVFCWDSSIHETVQFEFPGPSQASPFFLQIEPTAAYNETSLTPKNGSIITMAAGNCAITTIQ
jgi:hypothetical protein